MKAVSLPVPLASPSLPRPIPWRRCATKCAMLSAAISAKTEGHPSYGSTTSGMKCWLHEAATGHGCSRTHQGAATHRLSRRAPIGRHIRLQTEQPKPHALTVPNHATLKLGTLSAILSDVAQHRDIGKEELLRLLFGKQGAP